MFIELDTFLVTVYTVIDDLYRARFAADKPVRRGRRPVMSDSEVLTLMVVGQWLGNSERALLRYATAQWRSYFPRLLERSAVNRRARDLGGVLVRMVPWLAQALGADNALYQVLDGVPVPLARRCRGDRHKLFGDEAGVGRGGSDRDWYYGMELVLAVTDAGAITGFVLGPPSTDDRWFAEALLCWRVDRTATPRRTADLPPGHRAGGGRVGPTGPLWPRAAVGAASVAPYIADGGFHGAAWQPYWHDQYGARLLTPRDLGPTRRHPARWQCAGWRQVIETVNSILDTPFHLAFPGAHSTWGVLVRVAAKLVAFNLALLLNRFADRPLLACTTLAA